MTESVEQALALVRFLWAIADRIAHHQTKTDDGSGERCNPDVMENDLARFCEVNRLNEFNVDVQALFQISRSRYPRLFEADHPSFHHQLRMGRVESFCELHRARNDVHVDIFVPYRMTFSLMLSKTGEQADRYMISIKLDLLDSYLNVREAVIDASEQYDSEVIDPLTSTVARHIQSAILAFDIDNAETALDVSIAMLRRWLDNTTVTFLLANNSFSGLLYVEGPNHVLPAAGIVV